MTTTEQLITSPEAGAILGKSARTVLRLADRGVLPIAQRLSGPNGAYLFHQADVDALARELRSAGTQ